MATFEKARAEWLRARAAVADIDAGAFHNLPDRKADRVANAALNALREAEWQLMREPAIKFCDIRSRAEIVQEMFAAAQNAGRPTDNRHQLMLDALVSEILRYEPQRELDGEEH